MFESVEGRSHGRTDAGLTGIIYANLWALGQGELTNKKETNKKLRSTRQRLPCLLCTSRFQFHV